MPGAAYVLVRDERGETLAEAVEESLGKARPAAVSFAEQDLGDRLVERTLSVGDREMLHVVALVTFRGKSEVQYLDPLGLNPAAGAGGKVLGSVEDRVPARPSHEARLPPRAAARQGSRRSSSRRACSR